MYADLDTAATAPLESWIRQDDELVAGLETDSPSGDAMLARGDVRRRQVLQWAFAAAAGHPALLLAAERIADATLEGSGGQGGGVSEASTLERTGPGLFSDVVREAAHQAAAGDAAWRVRLLPRVAMASSWDAGRGRWELSAGDTAARPVPLAEDDPRVVLRHYAAGSWKAVGGAGSGLLTRWSRTLRRTWQRAVAAAVGAGGEDDDAAGSGDAVLTPDDVEVVAPARGSGAGFWRDAAVASLTSWGDGGEAENAALDAAAAAAAMFAAGEGEVSHAVIMDAAACGASMGSFALRSAARSGSRVVALCFDQEDAASLEGARAAATETGAVAAESLAILHGALVGDTGCTVRSALALMPLQLPRRLARRLWRAAGGVRETVPDAAWEERCAVRLGAPPAMGVASALAQANAADGTVVALRVAGAGSLPAAGDALRQAAVAIVELSAARGDDFGAALRALRAAGFRRVRHVGPGCRQHLHEAGVYGGATEARAAGCELPAASNADLAWWSRGGGVETLIGEREF